MTFDASRSGVYVAASAVEPRPGLARCKPEKKRRRESLAPFFARWCRQKGMSVRDVATVFDCTIAGANEILQGRKPIHWEDLFALPQRFRHELYFAAEAEMSGVASSSTAIVAHR